MFFSNREATGGQVANGDAYSISVNELGEYWISGEVGGIYQGERALSKKQAFLCLHETARLNREGLIPAWTTGVSGKEITSNVVTRCIEDFREARLITAVKTGSDMWDVTQ